VNPRKFADPIFGPLNIYLKTSMDLLGQFSPDWIKTFSSSAKYFAPGIPGSNMFVEVLKSIAHTDVAKFGKSIFSTFDTLQQQCAQEVPQLPSKLVQHLLLAASQIIEPRHGSTPNVSDSMDQRFTHLILEELQLLHHFKSQVPPHQFHDLMTPLEYTLSLCERHYLSRWQVKSNKAIQRTMISKGPLSALRRIGAQFTKKEAKRGTMNLGLISEILQDDLFRLPERSRFHPATSVKLEPATLYLHGPGLPQPEAPEGTPPPMNRPLIEMTPSKHTLGQMNKHLSADHPQRNALLLDLFRDMVLTDPGVIYWLDAYGQQSLGHAVHLRPVRLLSYAQDDKIRWVHVLFVVED
jgi:hypothetical protein